MLYQLIYTRIGPGILFIVLFFPSLLQAQFHWEPFNDSLYGAAISDMVFNADNQLVVGTGHGIYVHEEGGSEELDIPDWIKVDTIIRNPELVRTQGGVLYARTNYGMYVSYDGGYTWEVQPAMVEAFPNRLTNSGIKLDNYGVINDSTVVWIYNKMFYVSAHWGNKLWKYKLPDDIERPKIGMFKGGGDGSIYYLYGGKIWYISGEFSALRWEEITTPDDWSSSTYKTAIEGIGSDTIVLAAYQRVARSTDKGKTWHSSDGPTIERIVKGQEGVLYGYVRRDETLYDESYYLYQSTDAGLTWNKAGWCDELPCLMDKDGTLFQGTYGRLYHSTDSGENWQEFQTDMQNIQVDDLVRNPTHHSSYITVLRKSWTLVYSHRPEIKLFGLYHATDDRGQWQLLRDSVSHIVGVDSTGNIYVQEDRVLAPEAQFDVIEARLWVSRDDGKTWQNILTIVSYFKQRFTLHSSKSGVAVVGILKSHYDPKQSIELVTPQLLSRDSGKTWIERTEWLPESIGKLHTFHILDDGDILFSTFTSPGPVHHALWHYYTASGDLDLLDTALIGVLVPGPGGTLYSNRNHFLGISADNGISWDSRPVPVDTTFLINDIVVSPASDIYLQGRSDSMGIAQIYVSSDRGSSWDDVSYISPSLYDKRHYFPQVFGPDVLIDRLGFRYPNQPWLLEGYNNGYFGWSTNRGMTWQLEEGDLQYIGLSKIVLTENRDVYVGTREDGVYRTTGFLSVEEHVQTNSPETTLHVSPIPVDDHLSILLTTVHSGYVHLDLFDCLGRPLDITVDQFVEPGEHRFVLDVQELPTGSYFLRLTTDNQREAVKILVQ